MPKLFDADRSSVQLPLPIQQSVLRAFVPSDKAIQVNPAIRALITTGLLTMILWLGFFHTAQATHWRYGTVSWRPVATTATSGYTIEFKLLVSYRWGFPFTGGANPPVGKKISVDPFQFGDNQRITPSLTVTSTNAQEDYLLAEATFTHTYAAKGNFTAFYGQCCRLSSLQNNHDADYYVATLVNVGTNNSSPISSLVPIVNLATGLPNATFQIPANDPNGSPLSFSLATANDVKEYDSPNTSIPGFTQPANLTVSATGLVNFNTVGKPLSTTYVDQSTNSVKTTPLLYNVVVKISDGTSFILVDFIIRIVANTGNSPTFVYGGVTPAKGAIIQTSVGSAPTTFTVQATDPDVGDVVSLQSAGLPPSATFPPVSATGTASSTFSFTPSVAGTSVITFIATDNIGHQTLTSVTIQVCNPISPTLMASSGGLITCTNTSVTLTAGGAGGNQYVFLGPNGFNQSGATNTASVTQAGTFTVTVSGNNSCPTSLTTSVVSNTASPQDVTLSASGMLTCAQTSAVLSAGSSTTGVTYAFSGTGITAQSSNRATVNKPGTFTVVLTGPNGCTASATTSVTSDTALPNVTITPSATTICAGQSTTLTASGGASYIWSTTDTTPSISVTAAGPYSVTATSANGCSNTATASVTVRPLPVATFTGLPPNICVNATPLSLSPTTAGGSFTGPGVSGNTFNPASAGVGGPYSITYTVSSSGCSNSSSQSITVNPLPALTIVNLSAAYCQNALPVSLTGTPAGGNFTVDGNTAISISPSSLSVGQHTVVYSYTNASGCSNTVSQSVTINALPAVSITPAAVTICAGQTTTLTATPGLTYLWSTGQQVTASISVSLTGTYSVTGTNATTGCSNTASASVSVTPLPNANFTGLPSNVCVDASPITLTPTTAGGVFTGPGINGNQFSPASAGVGGPYTITYAVTSQGCSNTTNQTVTVKQLAQAPTLVTTAGQPYPAGVSSLTISQNVGNVILTVSGCAGGTISWNGGSATTLAVSTTNTGVFTYSATCMLNGCTSPAASFSLTVVPTTLSVLHRDADYGNLTNNIIKPFLELANASTSNEAIPYNQITVRYWFTSEGQAPPTNLAVYYARLGTVNMQYVALSQPRQGAFGYVEYSFPNGGSLPAGDNSGPIENGIQKTDGSNFDESDDYSYQANYADYVSNAHITAYRNGVIFWGQEPATVTSQTAVQVYSAAKDEPTASQIQPRTELRNTGNVALPVANLKLRYYFTSDNGQLASVYVDYADIGASNVTAQVVKLAQPVNGADSYVELSFPGSSLLLNPRSSLGYIDFRVVRSDYGLFDQTNDYSYAPSYGNLGLNNHITAYLNNTLVFGTPPSGALRVATSEPVAALSVRMLGNPVAGTQAQVEIRGAEGRAVSLRLVDLQGRSVHEQRIEQAGPVEPVSVPLGQSRGTLLLSVSTDGQQQVLKLVRP